VEERTNRPRLLIEQSVFRPTWRCTIRPARCAVGPMVSAGVRPKNTGFLMPEPEPE
jgi:hypothetical protein